MEELLTEIRDHFYQYNISNSTLLSDDKKDFLELEFQDDVNFLRDYKFLKDKFSLSDDLIFEYNDGVSITIDYSEFLDDNNVLKITFIDNDNIGLRDTVLNIF